MLNLKNIYLDLDGTIVNKNGDISYNTLKAIQHLKSKGIKIGIATGRHYYAVQKEIDLIKPELPTICINGAVILSDKKSILVENFLDYEWISLIDKLIEFGFSFVIYTKNGIYTNNENNLFFRKTYNRLSKLSDEYINFDLQQITNLNWLKTEKTYKIIVSFDSSHEKEILLTQLQSLKNIAITSSSEDVLEFMPISCSKGKAISTMAIALEQEINSFAVFGDNENDISMFDVVPNSIALSDAIYKLKEKATYITELTCDDDGFADFVFKYL